MLYSLYTKVSGKETAIHLPFNLTFIACICKRMARIDRDIKKGYSFQAIGIGTSELL